MSAKTGKYQVTRKKREKPCLLPYEYNARDPHPCVGEYDILERIEDIWQNLAKPIDQQVQCVYPVPWLRLPGSTQVGLKPSVSPLSSLELLKVFFIYWFWLSIYYLFVIGFCQCFILFILDWFLFNFIVSFTLLHPIFFLTLQ